MTAENQGQVEDGSVEQPNEPSAIELKAMEMGWRPKEEFSGDEVDFIDAKEFVARKPLYDKIAQQSKALKNTIQAVEALREHNGKVEEAAFQRALKELKSERKQALVEGDADKFESLDDEIKEVESKVATLKAEQNVPLVKEEPTIHPEFAHWQNRNRWYTDTKYMREFADELGGRLANTMSPSEVLKEVEKAVRKEFPQKFVNQNKSDAPNVDSSQGTGSIRGAGIQLTDQEKRIMDTLVRSGTMTKEKYIADLKKVKGL